LLRKPTKRRLKASASFFAEKKQKISSPAGLGSNIAKSPRSKRFLVAAGQAFFSKKDTSFRPLAFAVKNPAH
jgi:hypothetical protein